MDASFTASPRPCGYRMSSKAQTTSRKHYIQQQSNSLPNSMARGNRSQSIPISNSIRRTASEHQMCQDEAEADYRDYLFFSRVVHGISSKQETYQDGYLKYENELSLHNIMRTRNEAHLEKASCDKHNNLLTCYDVHGNLLLYNPFPPMDPAEQDAYEAGIFDLDL